MRTRAPWTGLLLWAAGCAIAATAILWSIPLVFGSPDRIVKITWRVANPADRAALEQRFALTAPVLLENDVWGYVPGDTSRATLRALATHPQVAVADGIDRRTFQFARSPPLSPRRGGVLETPPAWMPRAARLLAYGLVLLAVMLLCGAIVLSPFLPAHSGIRPALAALNSDPAGTLKRLPTSIRLWVQRGVPIASAQSAGLFRIVFGTAVLAYVVTNPVNSQMLDASELANAGGPYGMAVRWAGAHPTVVQQLRIWLQVSGVLFIAGVVTPASFAAFVGGFLLWACVYTLTSSAHAVAVLGVTLLCLMPARWGDAWSVDALLRRLLGRPRPFSSGRQYGFAFWVPRLVLGMAFLSAAWSKVAGGGLDWILNGTVKYYFVSDFKHALVPWGPSLTEIPWVAVLMSGAAVLTEALVVTAAFSRSDAYALLLAAGATALLAGFVLFQGVLWWGWWILLIAFLPWHRIRRRSATRVETAASSLSLAQAAIVSAVVVQQVIVSMAHVEARPLLSAYDMYSATYASAQEYEDAINLVYRVVVFEGGEQRELPDCVVDDRAASLVPAAAAGAVAERERLRGVLAPCLEAAPLATAFALEGDREVYNWETRRFEWQRGLDVLGPVPADWLRQ